MYQPSPCTRCGSSDHRTRSCPTKEGGADCLPIDHEEYLRLIDDGLPVMDDGLPVMDDGLPVIDDGYAVLD